MMRRNLGRQKVPMARMTNESHLLVTFSKRRAGVFKKASEISVLCGAESVIVVVSPGNKVYSFGHPSVDIIADRYLGVDTPDTSGTAYIVEARRNAHIHELGMHLDLRTSQIDDEMKRGQELDQVIKASQQQNWWERPIEELDQSQLLQLKDAFVELKKKVEAEKLAVQNENLRQFYLGSSSSGWMVPGFNENMVVGEYNMILPTPGYNLHPAPGFSVNPVEGYSVNPPEGYNLNPAEGYSVNPAGVYTVDPIEEYVVDPPEGTNIHPADGDDAKPEGTDTPCLGGGYIMTPEENEIYEKVLKDLDEGLF